MPAELQAVTFGFTEIRDEAELGSTDPLTGDKVKNAGLGNGPGGQLARSYLGSTAVIVLDPYARRHDQRGRGAAQGPPSNPPYRPQLPEVKGGTPRIIQSLNEGPEPAGMFLALLLNESGKVVEKDLALVKEHRWTFKGADDIAAQGRNFFFFIRCLLELQRNVQLDEDGDALDPKLKRACKGFVNAQCREGRMGDMYQLFTHFLSNSLIFHEWDQFLQTAFTGPRKNVETYIVPNLEQVWSRYNRFRTIVESIFDLLDERFAWRHRLPKVGELVQDQMKRRCIFRDHILNNELFTSSTNRNEVIKQVKLTFHIGN